MIESTAVIEFTRAYLAAFYTFVAVFYAVRIVQKKRAGLAVVVFPGLRLSPSWWNHMLFRGFRLAIWLVCLFRFFDPGVDAYLGIIDGFHTGPVVLAGNLLLTVGFLFTLAVHFQLGREWRSGIDPAGPQKLLTERAFAYSRNPMFVGIATAQIGFLLALPSLFSAVCLVFGLYTLHRQAIEEEAHLMKNFAEEYLAYSLRVRRWL